MDWWSRLLGTTPRRPPAKITSNDPQLRYAKFKRSYDSVLALCNQPRNLAAEGPLLDQLHDCLERIALLIREESRAPAPHYALQLATTSKIYAVITRAATVSQHEPILNATVSILAALIDSEEEDFLANAQFAKSLMRMVTKVLNDGTIVIGIETETAILELLFTIAAKIRLQPEILSNWFHSSAKPELEDVFVQEKKSFVGITAKADFPLCYLFIDRVHHVGRIGDFARTGLLYIFEATGGSHELEEWVVSSDLPTLMASGLGALYSQLSREVSILHPDAALPAVLAMSDYTTTHPKATAESVFSERHKAHMSTFLSSLAFWQDILDHCRSADVRQTLLDHFHILFLQQLLYPSLLQSSDSDAGSSVAVLTYVAAMLETLEHPALVDMMLEYLLAFEGSSAVAEDAALVEPPRSPTALRRKQSLLLLTAPKNPSDTVEPALFSLVDLILNNIGSTNSQSAFAALRLASTVLTRQKKFAFGTLVRVQEPKLEAIERTAGALDVEVEMFAQLAAAIHDQTEPQATYAALAEDVRTPIENQVPFHPPMLHSSDGDSRMLTGRYILSSSDHFMRAIRNLLSTFFTNSVDVNLALSQVVISMASCIEIRLDGWLALDPSSYSFDQGSLELSRPWQSHLNDDEKDAFLALQEASRRPVWSEDKTPMLYETLKALTQELTMMRSTVLDLDHLISVRKAMLQGAGLDTALVHSNLPSTANSPQPAPFLDVPLAETGRTSASSSRSSSQVRDPYVANTSSSLQPRSLTTSPLSNPSNEVPASPVPSAKLVYLPPPPEVPSTTDVLMQQITLPSSRLEGSIEKTGQKRVSTLNHVLTNVVILQEFVLELVAVLQVRAAVLGEREVRFA